MSSEDSTTDELMKEHEARIAMLERQKAKQEEQLALLRSELGAMQIKHKEESYWLRLEVDNLRRDKEATEDRLAELLRDLRELDVDEDPMAAPVCIDSHYVLHLQSQLSKSMQTMGILDNQITMVKSSCDEVVKSLKEEIADVMDDKCRMEMELMNQLAVLDHEKREREVEFDEQLRAHEDEIEHLKHDLTTQNQTNNSANKAPPNYAFEKGKENDLVGKINGLKEEKRKLEQEVANDKAQLGEAISRLQETNQEYEEKIDSLSSDLEVMRQGAAAEAVQVLDALTRDRQETLATLERVALIWEKADDSIQQLENVMDELRPLDEDQVEGDHERALSTLETASLVHAQIKVSLLLVELKLRNQLTSLKNDKLRIGNASGISDASVQTMSQKANEIQQEALNALSQVDQSLSQQIDELREESREGSDAIELELEKNKTELQRLQQHNKKLTEEVNRLLAETASSKGKNGEKSTKPPVSRALFEQLEKEVLTVVEKMREKNDTIARLNKSMDEHKVREAALKKELKRMMKRARTVDDEKDQVPLPSRNRRNSSLAQGV